MIYGLIQQVILLLQQSFVGTIADPESHIVAGPVPEPGAGDVPLIALSAAGLEMNQNFKDTGSSQPRPQEFRQEIAVNAANPQGPYSLTKTPLQKSTLCKLIFDQGTLTERHASLVEDKDFTIDYGNRTIFFSNDVASAGTIALTYSFVGVYMIREFQQVFLVDVYDDDHVEVEKWASLITSMILTNQDELIEHYNVTAKTEYIANQFLTTHTIDRIHILSGNPNHSGSLFNIQLRYEVAGQMKLIREIIDGFGIIEKIHSPGRISEQPVDIDIDLE